MRTKDYKLKELLKHCRVGANITPTKTGDTKFLQLKHFNFNDNQLLEIDSFVNMNENLEKQLLISGDVLFVTKGNRHFAWCHDSNLTKTVASSLFIVLHPIQELIDSRFLALYFNSPQILTRISDTLVRGSIIPTISRGDLLEFTIQVPPMEIQQNLVNISNSHRQQMALLEQLKQTKTQYYNLLINQSLSL